MHTPNHTFRKWPAQIHKIIYPPFTAPLPDGYFVCPVCSRAMPKWPSSFHGGTVKWFSGMLCRSCYYRYDHGKQGVPHFVKRNFWPYALEYWHDSCAVCGQKADADHKLHVDHWYPAWDWKNHGKPIITNFVPLCGSTQKGDKGCNNRKAYRYPDAWLKMEFGEAAAAQKMAEVESFFDWMAPYREAILVEIGF